MVWNSWQHCIKLTQYVAQLCLGCVRLWEREVHYFSSIFFSLDPRTSQVFRRLLQVIFRCSRSYQRLVGHSQHHSSSIIVPRSCILTYTDSRLDLIQLACRSHHVTAFCPTLLFSPHCPFLHPLSLAPPVSILRRPIHRVLASSPPLHCSSVLDQ